MRRPARRTRGRKREAGLTLAELTVVVAIKGVLASLAVPRIETAMETSRVDLGAAVLRSIWNAERDWQADHRTFTADLDDLVSARLLDSSVVADRVPFTFSVVSAGPDTFVARALRADGGSWSGSLTVDETGALDGEITNEEGTHVHAPAR